MKGKNRRSGGTVQLEYLIHIQELKPWPPSQSLRSIRSVLLQWENGERASGSTKLVSSSLDEGKIKFNESFRLSVTLVKDMSVKNADAGVFQKNALEFNLYEPRRDKIVKGQLLGTAIVDLADCGIVRESLSISVPLNCKRNYRNTEQPLLFVKIEPVEKNRAKSTLKDSLSKENCSSGDSVSALMSGEYAEEAEIASITDDDVSSHSSAAAVTNSPESSGHMLPNCEENGSARKNGRNDKEHHLVSETRDEKLNMMQQDMYARPERSPGNGHNSMENTPNYGLETTQKHVVSPGADYFPISLEESSMSKSKSSDHENSNQEIQVKASLDSKNPGSVKCDGLEIEDKLNERCEETDKYCLKEGGSDEYYYSSVEDKLGNISKSERLKYVKSVRSSGDSTRSIGSHGSNHHGEVKENGISGDAQNNGGNIRSSDRKDGKVYPRDSRNTNLDSKIQYLENKIKMLEGELRETASVEAALYSVAAEHGSSMSKVHAPARRLSRLYIHACKENIPARRSGAAKSAVSGLVLVAKACGNDVPRLTFWLSNSIVLRTIICQTTKGVARSSPFGSSARRKSGEGNGKAVQPLIWKGFSPKKSENIAVEYEGFANWDDPNVFTSALEKVETWIFSRIVESIWWQSLTPHMQLVDAKITHNDVSSVISKSFTKMSSLRDQKTGNLSLDIWKNAFKESCERICPVRALGHECGCLSVLPRLVMEQCIARLDVAMFNAILRESADDIPSDPISDPISDPKVLPIPPGKSSFGAGALLKTAVGNWSRWLTDLFDMDDDDSHKDKDDDIDNNDGNSSFKAFHLLNALSDLLMLPKDMLLSSSIRKEVCPMFGVSIIKKILDNFVPDEFCPDPIPTDVFVALDSQDDLDEENESVNNFPCIAAPIVYSPPQAITIANIVGEIGHESQISQLRRSKSSVVRKSHTSDDELDELKSPLSSILFSNSSSPVSTKPNLKWKESHNESSIRYELLRNVWMNSN
ncbi:uncharacterized protein LOC131609075 [Vicia villosa]|uniref:uncharacterized protein LOC131609075 n=1 Tax=Vicia villosa TaxID=3911 RepID=UPI00273B6CD2|nr:uncharacterized protein LOC131609075 [Vicia villosa]XP_058736699.1 uncharacterized protein LOC131609075 [Vicia villosa]